jgi:DNA (cytosine-5)-methyltransferase 1
MPATERRSSWRFVDLFAGCGGMSWGFREAGFEPVAAVEMDVHAAATHAVNFGGDVFVGDIADWLKGAPPKAEIVIGGPPCQGFSALGSRDPDDPRNELWRRYMEALQAVEPVFFVLENVPQFLQSRQFEMLRRQTRKGGRLAEYRIESHILDASDYGVPQARRRAIVIGRPVAMDPLGRPPAVDGPKRTVREVFDAIDIPVSGTSLPASTEDVLGHVVPGVFKMRDLHVTRNPTDLSLRRYRAIPPGGNRFDLPDDLKAPCWVRHTSGSGDVMGRLRWDEPSVTIRTEFYKPEKGRYLHPVEDRPVTHLEAALLQTFPDDFLWCGTKVSIARQIGNAVPPTLARSIAGRIVAAAE